MNQLAFISIAEGSVYACGLSENGQLGTGRTNFKEYQPVKVNFSSSITKIVDICCGNYYTTFLSSNYWSY